ncbi:hypothetical protein, partial [Clostridium botulinum]
LQMENNKLSIQLLKDCWGGYSYFGYKEGKQHTEAYDNITELKEDNTEFRSINTVLLKNNYNWLFKITDNKNLLSCNSDTIEKLKAYNDSIFFNDLSGKYWIFDFEINDIWFEEKDMDYVERIMELNIVC